MSTHTPAHFAPQPLDAGHSAQPKLFQLLSRGLSACTCALQQRRRRAQLRAELQNLNARELTDLAIGQGELDYWLTQTQPGLRRP